MNWLERLSCLDPLLPFERVSKPASQVSPASPRFGSRKPTFVATRTRPSAGIRERPVQSISLAWVHVAHHTIPPSVVTTAWLQCTSSMRYATETMRVSRIRIQSQCQVWVRRSYLDPSFVAGPSVRARFPAAARGARIYRWKSPASSGWYSTRPIRIRQVRSGSRHSKASPSR